MALYKELEKIPKKIPAKNVLSERKIHDLDTNGVF